MKNLCLSRNRHSTWEEELLCICYKAITLAFNKHVKIFAPWKKHIFTPIICGKPQIFGANIAI